MLKYYFKRISIFLLFYVGLGLLINGVIIIREFINLDTSLWALTKTNFVSIFFLLMEFCFAILPFSVYLALLPQKRHNGTFDKYFTGLFFVLFFYLSAFKTVSEYFFWDEFASRFNFIAVDYLVYTQEVIENIYQSYPIITILVCALAITLVIWFLFRNLFVNPTLKAPRFKQRLTWLGVNIALCLLIAFETSVNFGEISLNRYNNELAKSGAYSFVYAFFHNELDYKTFYPTLSPAQARDIIRQRLATKGTQFKDDGILRAVTPAAAEIHPNVVIVLMESMGAKFMEESKEFWQDPVTPYLSRFAREGVYFANTYSTGTRTVRGIEAVTVSLPPLPGMSVVRRQGNEDLHSIGSIFRERGYKTQFIYGGYGYFDNMNYYFASNGFDVLDRVSMNKTDITFANAWGVCDQNLFTRAIEEADKDYSQKRPFFQFVLTTSNHRPFTYPEGTIDIPSGTGRRGAVKYADYAVGKFIEEASKKPWFDNTVFVFVADHGPGSAGKQELAPVEHRIPFIIYAPKLFKARKIDMPVSQIDVAPTLLGLLNFKYNSYFFGRDALGKDYKTRLFLNNYQKVGMIEDDIMTVLKPVREVDFYKGSALEPLQDKAAYNEYLKTAEAYYQTADQWKLYLHKTK